MADDDIEEEGRPDEGQSEIKALRARAERATELEKELDKVRRESAFAKALGPALDDDRRLKYFVQGYDGEMTPEAIRQRATEDGFFQGSATQAETTDLSRHPDLSGHQRFQDASRGASEPRGVDLEEAIKAAKSPEEVMTLMEKAGYPTVRGRQ